MNIAFGAVVAQQLPVMVKFPDLIFLAFWMIWKFPQRMTGTASSFQSFYFTEMLSKQKALRPAH